jgi:hypothetical protein
MSSRLIELDLAEVSLLLEWKSGVIYRNQVGGNVCYPAEMEGVFVPLDVDDGKSLALQSLPYQSGGIGVSEEIGREIHRLLQASLQTNCISVDFSRLSESWEAWIHVIVDSPEEEKTSVFTSITMKSKHFGPVYGFGRVRGVLTWANSD